MSQRVPPTSHGQLQCQPTIGTAASRVTVDTYLDLVQRQVIRQEIEKDRQRPYLI